MKDLSEKDMCRACSANEGASLRAQGGAACPMLSKKDIEEILYLSSQGCHAINRIRLITSLYRITKPELYSIVSLYG